MSFVPTILVRKKDLDQHISKLESFIEKVNFSNNLKEKEGSEYTAITTILHAAKNNIVSFPELKFIIINSEFISAKNKAIRDILTDLNVEYRLFD